MFKLLGPGAIEVEPGTEPAVLRRLFADYPVLVLRNRRLSAREFAEFAAQFGRLERYPAPPPGQQAPIALLEERAPRATPDQRLYACEEHDGVLLMTNEVKTDAAPLAVIDNAECWHADGSHKEVPYRAVALHALRNPVQGGETEFCDLTALYAALPDELKAWLIGQSAAHHWSKSLNPRFAALLTPAAREAGELIAAIKPETLQPLVCEDALSGRPHLFLSPRFTLRIPGILPALSEKILEAVFAMMEAPAFIYRHVWREGDLVLWDNRRTNHRVLGYGAQDPRSRYRASVAGEEPMRACAALRQAA